MRFLVIVKANKDSEAGRLPDGKLVAEMQEYNEELVKAGIMLDADGLQPSSKGFRVRFEGGERQVIPGPFPETEQLVAGFWIWQAKSTEEAIGWLKRAPFGGGVEVELRPMHEAEDFAPIDPDGKLRSKERELRKMVELRIH